MNNLLNQQRTGLALGLFAGICHAIWALLVLFGLAQPWLNFIFKMHFIQPIYLITAFNLGIALLLIIITFIVGYIFGWLFATVWNWVQKK